jgi:hypothetical protein
MVREEFRFELDDEYGSMGWRPKSTPDFNVNSNGAGVAHDFLEHVHGDSTLEGEVMAFGAMIYGRGMSGWFYGQAFMGRSAEETMGSSLESPLRDAWWNFADTDSPLKDVPGFEPPLDDGDAEGMIEQVAHYTMADLIKERGYSGDEGNYSLRALVDTNRRLKRWMRRGWRDVQRRFPNVSGYALADLFTEIRDKVDAIRITARGGEEDEGTTMLVEVNPDSLQVRVQVTHPDELFDESLDEEDAYA